MLLKLYNTKTKSLCEVKKQIDTKVYACGPTVYNYAHVGNLRTYIFEDILIKSLRLLKYNVNYAMNITDIGHLTGDFDEGEDKMVKAARERGLTVYEISRFFTEVFFRDCEKLNIVRPDKVLIASEYIDSMIKVVKILEQNGFTYFVNGNVYFDTFRFKNYGQMAGINLDNSGCFAVSRVEVDPSKKNKSDFVLWFTNSKFKNQEMKWDSPWGFGYPSWHLECAAMNLDYFKSNLDIHLGGVDHIGVHHINEIAIAECYLNKMWCEMFVHGEFLIMEDEKMSKSNNNFVTIKDLEVSGFSPLDFRYFCLTAHYRNQLKFTFNNLTSCRIARENMLKKLISLYSSLNQSDIALLSEIYEDVECDLENEYYDSFLEKIAFDLNIPQVLALLWDVIRDDNLNALLKLKLAFRFDVILSLGLKEEVLRDIERDIINIDDTMNALLEERRLAKLRKDFDRADEIREYFYSKGFVLIDTREGTKVKRG
ncbi:cysteine--tRNA ligase [Borrelia anserina]|uniref:Cysteine--tRNA ligase n=2 Tax=Borrelia anserina TaxID=143 RepID=W5SNT4_BORAN|nr:cysteine--tRNA ligase [Borrelia anserina]AHH08572.1 Cysteinyl-tRNA synthetase [Borrelia anserina BA2]APR65039.1 cysteine--tRNA ligase [Borrelia anserina Es]UPA06963.1 cysteine--tRNA ligase [Borrelia anserina]